MNKHKHLEFIQAVIAVLSEHSFRLKTFSLIQVGAIAAFVAARALYEKVRLTVEDRVDFGMSVDRGKVLAALRSPSLSLFYLTLVASSLFVALAGLGGGSASAEAPGS